MADDSLTPMIPLSTAQIIYGRASIASNGPKAAICAYQKNAASMTSATSAQSLESIRMAHGVNRTEIAVAIPPR
jgi:hypothetical protein